MLPNSMVFLWVIPRVSGRFHAEIRDFSRKYGEDFGSPQWPSRVISNSCQLSSGYD